MSAQDSLRVVESFAHVAPDGWDALAGGAPFLRHAFLAALESSGCIGGPSGWLPRILLIENGTRPTAALPMFAKSHSFGEFVYDWSWAEAWQRAGLAYYPKWVTASPFSPVAGPRLLAADQAYREALIDVAMGFVEDSGLSSWHVLFPTESELSLLAGRGLLVRHTVQFHWINRGFRDFGDYLDSLTRDKRKKARQERRRVAEAGVSVRRLTGPEITPEDWRFFFRCYRNTYLERGQSPHLNLDFFRRLGDRLGQHVLLVLAERGGHAVAAALDLFDGQRLYGRYWGAAEFVPGLHFEACYYQGIEFCIERGLEAFEGGAGGEHKLSRGFEPVTTASAHWIRDRRMADAVRRFLVRESEAVGNYVDELNEHAPFRG